MSPGRKLGMLLAAGIAFGVIIAAIKGQDTGVRNALGNTSAPWILVPFFAGSRYSSVRAGVLVGVATTVASLAGFYAAEAVILDLGPHPWYVDLQLTMGSGHIYYMGGLATGSVYGMLGALWSSRRLSAPAIALGLAFVAEPLIVLVLARAAIWGDGLLLDYPWMWMGEVLVGLGLGAYALSRVRRPLQATT